jgi:hypothetical protein
MIRVALLYMLVWSGAAGARVIEQVDFPEQIEAGGAKLVLNGVGLRVKRRMGIGFRVYVAGLYLPSKSGDATALIAGESTALVELAFLRGLDAETLRGAWKEGFEKNCVSSCKAAAPEFAKFNAAMTAVNEGDRLALMFTANGVELRLGGKTTTLAGRAARAALLGIFLGSEPPTTDLKNGLLGK